MPGYRERVRADRRRARQAGDRATDRAADPTGLLGAWEFVREIDDRRHGVRGRVTGEMIFAAEEDRIRWTETGTLDWGDVSAPVSRTLWLTEGAGGWIVTFADGRYFHDWRPGGDPVRHPCGADHYLGSIVADPDGAGPVTINWEVIGPAKDYTATTRLTRPPSR